MLLLDVEPFQEYQPNMVEGLMACENLTRRLDDAVACRKDFIDFEGAGLLIGDCFLRITDLGKCDLNIVKAVLTCLPTLEVFATCFDDFEGQGPAEKDLRLRAQSLIPSCVAEINVEWIGDTGVQWKTGVYSLSSQGIYICRKSLAQILHDTYTANTYTPPATPPGQPYSTPPGQPPLAAFAYEDDIIKVDCDNGVLIKDLGTCNMHDVRTALASLPHLTKVFATCTESIDKKSPAARKLGRRLACLTTYVPCINVFWPSMAEEGQWMHAVYRRSPTGGFSKKYAPA